MRHVFTKRCSQSLSELNSGLNSLAYQLKTPVEIVDYCTTHLRHTVQDCTFYQIELSLEERYVTILSGTTKQTSWNYRNRITICSGKTY